MTLATRCSACGIAFRVVEDQLKVAEGWVRCGRCSEVFDAVEGLFELAPLSDDGPFAPPDAATELMPGADAVAPIESVSELPETPVRSEMPVMTETPVLPVTPATVEPPRQGGTVHEESFDEHFFGSRRGTGRSGSAAHVSERDRLDFSDARFDSQLMADEESSADPAATPVGDPEATPIEGLASPAFVRHAESRARWQHPRVRAALAAMVAVLMVALVVQAGHQFRDLAAAQWPWARPILSEWCAVAECVLEAPRRINDISVESTALAKVAGSDAFRLSVTLHSRGNVAVAVPSIDLRLTDASGKAVARKVLGAQVLRPSAAALQPGADMVLQTLLALRDVEVAGYTVEIFYP